MSTCDAGIDYDEVLQALPGCWATPLCWQAPSHTHASQLKLAHGSKGAIAAPRCRQVSSEECPRQHQGGQGWECQGICPNKRQCTCVDAMYCKS